jgi:hypothetical protein
MRGAKSNALFLRRINRNLPCPLVALVRGFCREAGCGSSSEAITSVASDDTQPCQTRFPRNSLGTLGGGLAAIGVIGVDVLLASCQNQYAASVQPWLDSGAAICHQYNSPSALI